MRGKRGTYLLVIGNSKTTVVHQDKLFRLPIVSHTQTPVCCRHTAGSGCMECPPRTKLHLGPRSDPPKICTTEQRWSHPLFGRLTGAAKRVRNVEVKLGLDDGGWGVEVHGAVLGTWMSDVLSTWSSNTSPQSGPYPTALEIAL